MNILVINCGSSSLKYQLIDSESEKVLAKGLCERIGIEGSVLTHQPTGKDKYVTEQPITARLPISRMAGRRGRSRSTCRTIRWPSSW